MHENIIIAGDFNSLRQKDYQHKIEEQETWELVKSRFSYAQALFNNHPRVFDLFEQYQYKTSFELKRWQAPKFTSWSGCALDFLFFSSKFAIPIQGSYVYYTDVSDHLPVIVDLQM